MKTKSKVIMLIMKCEHPADEQDRACSSAVTFACFVLMSGCIIMGKIITDNVSQPREKQTNQRTIHPSIRNVPIVQAVLMANQWLADFTRVSKLLGISFVSFSF